jgi:hypothetical protein
MSAATWIRRQRDRPIAEGERQRAMAAIVVLLAASALLLTLTRPGGQTPRHADQTASRLPGRASAAHAPPFRAGAAPLTPGVARAARLFLSGSLGYLYGHTPARQIKGATAGLLHSLQANPPRVSPATQARGARLVSLHSTPAPLGLAGVSAVVNDGGPVDYPIRLLLAPHAGRLLVSELGGA